MFSVVILTLNEEKNLPACVQSLQGISDDIAVLDSGSVDATVAIAKQLGVPVYSNPFTGFGDQRNWAIDNIPRRYPWTFHLDADERFTRPLADEISKRLAGEPGEPGFWVANKLMLGSRWLKYSSGYPVYQARFFHADRMRFENAGHGQREVAASQLGTLTEPYLHYAFSKGLEPWFQKHATYARREFELQQANSMSIVGDLGSVLTLSRTQRWRALKRLSYRMPARSTLRLLHLLVLQGGILDGRAGLLYARMLCVYEEMAGIYQAEVALEQS